MRYKIGHPKMLISLMGGGFPTYYFVTLNPSEGSGYWFADNADDHSVGFRLMRSSPRKEN